MNGWTNEIPSEEIANIDLLLNAIETAEKITHRKICVDLQDQCMSVLQALLDEKHYAYRRVSTLQDMINIYGYFLKEFTQPVFYIDVSRKQIFIGECDQLPSEYRVVSIHNLMHGRSFQYIQHEDFSDLNSIIDQP